MTLIQCVIFYVARYNYRPALQTGERRSGILFIYAHAACFGKGPESVYHIKTDEPSHRKRGKAGLLKGWGEKGRRRRTEPEPLAK